MRGDVDGEEEHGQDEEGSEAAVEPGAQDPALPERRVGVGPPRRHPPPRGGRHGQHGGGGASELPRGAVRLEQQHPRDLARVLATPRLGPRSRRLQLRYGPVRILHLHHHRRPAPSPRLPPPPRRHCHLAAHPARNAAGS
uniref:Uncharacterized protein n=1 Tax=Arundo donax TaxID=35708 RepID=A0A0A9FRX9_ARUDO